MSASGEVLIPCSGADNILSLPFGIVMERSRKSLAPNGAVCHSAEIVASSAMANAELFLGKAILSASALVEMARSRKNRGEAWMVTHVTGHLAV